MEKEFIELFKGYEGDFGMADMSKTELDSEKNKIKPNYEWAGRPVTLDDYRNHLQGRKSIGIQPCRIDKTAQFGCIDVDPPDYGSFKVEHYLALFQQYKLPLVPNKIFLWVSSTNFCSVSLSTLDSLANFINCSTDSLELFLSIAYLLDCPLL